MSQIQGKTVLITGASSGIGEATALLLARKGAQVVLGARRTDRLEKLTATICGEGGLAQHCTLDVTKLEEMQAFAELGLHIFGHVDAIVNNAGVMPLSQLQELKVDVWNRMIDVNIRGVLHGIAAVLPIMQKQGFGQVVNISSIGGHAVHPRAAVYSATKYAVIAISEGLRLENDKIRVTVVSPNVIESEPGEVKSAGEKLVVEPFASQDPWNEFIHSGRARNRLLGGSNPVNVALLSTGCETSECLVQGELRIEPCLQLLRRSSSETLFNSILAPDISRSMACAMKALMVKLWLVISAGELKRSCRGACMCSPTLHSNLSGSFSKALLKKSRAM